MRITVVNDTRTETNPGCHATMAALEGLLQDVSGAVLHRVPLGLGHDAFAPMVAAGLGRSATSWQEGISRLAGNADVVRALDGSDLVVVNLEGTFHHHTVGALALAGIMSLACRRDIRVWAVNGTVQDIDIWLLQESLSRVSYLALREPVSATWLRTRGLRASLAADCAVLADVFARSLPWPLPPHAALYTPGVLARPDQPVHIGADVVEAHLEALAARGYTPVYFEMEEAEAAISAHIRAAGGHVLRAVDLPWQAVGTLVRECELVVSGRYHMLLFAAMAGVPSIALSSNTWKIAGLLDHLEMQRRVADTPDALNNLLAAGPPCPPRPAVIDRLRTLARRNVAGHWRAHVRHPRAGDRRVVIAPTSGPGAVVDARPGLHLPWPPPSGRNAAASLRSLLALAMRRTAGQTTVSGLELVPADELPAALRVLREAAPPQLDVVIDSSAGECWSRADRALRPLTAWRRLLEVTGFVIDAEEAGPARVPAAGTPAAHWDSLRAFRDDADNRPVRLRLSATPCEASVDDSDAVRRLIGLRPQVLVPDSLARGDVRVVFVVGTYQEYRQYLPLFAQLPPSTCAVVVKRQFEPGQQRRQQMLERSLRRRGIATTTIDSARDIAWPEVTDRRRAVIVTGAESTAYDSHLWTAAVVIAARERGYATVQLQHGIWPYADLERPMTWLSDAVLTWSDEFQRACETNVAWPEGAFGPRAPLSGARFHRVGCPLFDAYADSQPVRLEDVLGDWVTRYRRRILVATNLHWTQHRQGALVTPAVLALAEGRPDTLFVIKPHPVHDLAPDLLERCPPNVVVLDEFTCLWMGLDSARLIRACDAVVATQSTVALEAALAETPFVVVDSGNPNRYEHVTLVPPSEIGTALDAALEGRAPGATSFAPAYFDRARLGQGTSGVLLAIAAAATSGPSELSHQRQALALFRFAEHAAAYAGELAWSHALVANLQTRVDRLAAAAAVDPDRLGDLSARCAALEEVATARSLALLAPRGERALKVVLFGASASGVRALTTIAGLPHLEVIGFADNDSSRWGSRVEGVLVHAPEARWLLSADVIVVTSTHRNDIAVQVAATGCADRLVFDDAALQHVARLARTA